MSTDPHPAPPPSPAPQPGTTPLYTGVPPTPSAGLLGSLDLFRLIGVLKRKWVTVLLVLVFAGIAAAYYLLTSPRIYQASSLVELSVRRPRIMTQQAAVIDDANMGSPSEEVFNTRLEKFRGRTVQDAAVARYRKQHPDCTLPDSEFRRLMETSLGLTLLRRTKLVKIDFLHTDPAFAAAFCTTFTEAAEASAYDENRIASDAAVIWLETQARAQRGEVEKADATLLKYRQENKIDVMESQRKIVESSLLDFSKVLNDLESQEAKERDLLNALTAVELSPENIGKLPGSIPRDDEIKTALNKWLTALTERDALYSKYTPMHPEIQAKNSMVNLYRDQARDALARAKATTASNLELIHKQNNSLSLKRAEQVKAASALDLQIVERKAQLSSLERTRDAADAAFRGILQRIQEARMAADENTATIKIVDRPTVPDKPVRPKPSRIIALALIVGLAAGLGLALVIDAFEDHIEGPQDLEAGLNTKVLAIVPHVRRGTRRDIATASLHDRLGPVAETFAGLRTMLASPPYQDNSKVILVASSIPEEGKTVTCCNLAITCAKNGQRVLLVDFDLRRPRLGSVFGVPQEKRELQQYLVALENPSDMPAVFDTACPNLSLIATHPVKGASPADLVSSERVTRFMEWARSRYDRVIIDAPPLGLVSDALALAKLSDCVLIVARPNTSRRQVIAHTLHRFRESGARLLAGILNDVDFSSRRAYYGPYYHYSSHYRSYPQTTPSRDEG